MLTIFKSKKSESGENRDLARGPTPVPCMHCGFEEAVFLGTRTRPDFDVAVLPASIRDDFAERLDGICLRCGLYQEFRRYTPAQLREFRRVASSKDTMVSEEAYHSFPVPKEFVTDYETGIFEKRIEKWRDYFLEADLRPQRCLFFRPMFGIAPIFVKKEFDADVAGLEISEVCRRTIGDRIPEFRFLEGDIHGGLDGPFLDTGPYDVVFCFHTLVHCIDVHETLGRLRRLVRDGGCVVFSREVERKPTNPFHMIFPSEVHFRLILERHFDRIDRIDDCDKDVIAHINPFTVKGDSPDLVAWAGSSVLG